jgi:hypothetical protein
MGKPALSPAQVKRWFVGVLLVAAGVRSYLLWQYYCSSSDGVTYLRAAEDFYSGDLIAGLSSLYPHDYPVVIAAIYPLFGDWELAGQSLSLLFGVALLFLLSRTDSFSGGGAKIVDSGRTIGRCHVGIFAICAALYRLTQL